MVGVGAAVVLAVLTWYTLQTVRSQADSAQQQATTMRQQLETTDRPWIQIMSVNLIDGLGFYRRLDTRLPGAHADFKVVARNIGRSVAVHVKMTARLVYELPEDTDTTIASRERAICSAADPTHTTSKFTLFPDESTGNRLSGQLGCGGYELIPPDAFWPMPGETKFVLPVYTGCIAYQAPGSEHRHHTGFAYLLVKRAPNGIINHELFRFGEHFSADRVVLTEHDFGFSDVN